MKDAFWAIICWGTLILVVLYAITRPISPRASVAQTPSPYPIYIYPTTDFEDSIQGYWYCWDSGNPNPHHLGYPVNGDHLCTNRELGR